MTYNLQATAQILEGLSYPRFVGSHEVVTYDQIARSILVVKEWKALLVIGSISCHICTPP